MENKKTFVSPRVLQQVDVCLEEDFLVGGSAQNVMSLQSMGIDVENYDLSGEDESYTIEWD